MNSPLFYIAVSIAVLAVVAVLVFKLRTNENLNRLTPLASLAFGFVMAGIIFGQNRFIGYGLMGIGVLLSIVDIINRSKRG